MASHSKGARKKEFCTERKPTCSCAKHNSFRTICKPSGSWKVKGVKKDYEAHHLLCVATITRYLLKRAKIRNVVVEVVWCINEKVNMYPMPLWGQYVAWYSDWKNYDKKGDPRSPKFADYAAHNYGHNGSGSYKETLDRWTMDKATEIEKSSQDHTVEAANLATTLRRKSGRLKTYLVSRGAGTHTAWLAGVAASTSAWYVPFCMATTPAPRTFPLSSGRIDRLAQKAKTYGA